MTAFATLKALPRRVRWLWRLAPTSVWLSMLFSVLALGTVLVNAHLSEQTRAQALQLQANAEVLMRHLESAMQQRDEALAGWKTTSDQRDAILVIMEHQRVLLKRCTGRIPEWHL